ncbi:MAG: IS21 family transposase [Candidatus Dormibacteria bacterium]
MADVVEVLQHWQAGHSLRHLARSVGMGRDRLRRIVARAEADGIVPGGTPLGRSEWEARVAGWFPDRGRRTAPMGEQERAVARLHELVVAGLATNTASTVWQRLRDEQGLAVSVATFRRYVRKRVRAVRPEDVTVRKPPTAPGEVAEVDYGRLGMWTDPRTGKRHVVQGFTMTLNHSRRIFVAPVLRCDQATWVRCHVAAFEFFGGAPRQVRLDNLKTGVVHADIYDPQLNRAYAEMAEHYGVLIDPCRQGKPKDKPQVERAVPYARESYWRGRDWDGVMAMTDGALRWLRNVADQRPHRGLPGTVGAVFREREQPALLPLPRDPFEVAHWAKATVHPDCHVQVRRHFYSVPWRLVGRQLDVRIGERVVTVYHAGELVKTHVRERGELRYTDPDDFPEQKIAFLLRTPQWCRRQAADLGPAVVQLVDELLAEPFPLTRLRQAQAVIRLAEEHGAERLDAACQRALAADASYRTVRTLLINQRDRRVDDMDTHVSNAGAYLHGQQVLLENLR